MRPILIDLGGLSIYSWGTMLAIGVLLATYLAARQAKVFNIDGDKIMDLALVVTVGGLIGARLFYVIVYDPQTYLQDPVEIFRLWRGGLVFYGGLIGGILAGIWYVRRAQLPFWTTGDVVAPFLSLAYGIVRIGCFLNGCCYGKPTNSFLGVTFPQLDDLLRHPTQLYSSVAGFALFGILLYLLKNRKFEGQVLLAYVILYGLTRSIVEAFRENLTVLGPITVAQMVSLIMVIAAGILYYQRSQKAKSYPNG